MFDKNTRTIVVVGAQWETRAGHNWSTCLRSALTGWFATRAGRTPATPCNIADKSSCSTDPSGSLSRVRCAIGNGVVSDVETLFAEIDELVPTG